MSQFYYPITGGIERYACDLSRSLADLGLDVHVVTLKPAGMPRYEENENGVHIHRVAGRLESHFVLALPLMARTAERLCRRNGIDIIHGQIPHMPDVLVSRSRAKARFVETIHVPLDVETEPLRTEDFRDLLFWEKFVFASFPTSRIFERRVIDRADGLIGVSNSVKWDAVRSYDVSPDRITVIYEGISPDRYFVDDEGSVVRERLEVGDDPLVLFVGRQCARKRIELLIHALVSLKEEHGGVKLLIVGRETNYTRRLKNLALELGVADSIRFAGYVPDEELPRYYAACDVFALTSLHEAMGLSVLEAMASGKPTVVPNVGGLPEVIEDGRTGMLFEGLDGLVDSLSTLLSDERMARRMGAAGRRRVLERFTCQRMARETLRLYEKVLS